MILKTIASLMVVVSLAYWIAAFVAYRNAAGNWTIAGKVYRRTAIIFAVVGFGLFVVGTLTR